MEVIKTDDPNVFELDICETRVTVDISSGFISLTPILLKLKFARTEESAVEEVKKWLKLPNAKLIDDQLRKDDSGSSHYKHEETKEYFVHPAILLAFDDAGPETKRKLVTIAVYSSIFSQMLITFAGSSIEFMTERIKSINKRTTDYLGKTARESAKGTWDENIFGIVKNMRDDTINKLILCGKAEIATFNWLISENLEQSKTVQDSGNIVEASKEPSTEQVEFEEHIEPDIPEPTKEVISNTLVKIKNINFCGSVIELSTGGYIVILPSGSWFFNDKKLQPVKAIFKFSPFGHCEYNMDMGFALSAYYPTKKPQSITEGERKIVKGKIVELKVSDFGFIASCI